MVLTSAIKEHRVTSLFVDSNVLKRNSNYWTEKIVFDIVELC